MCGIVGTIAVRNMGSNYLPANLVVFGLLSIQGRGQESAGVSVSDGKKIKTYKKLGLVSEIFKEKTIIGLKGDIAIGQNRYSTTGGSIIENAQPVEKRGRYKISIVHNGNIDSTELRKTVLKRGIKLKGDSDTELIAALIANSSAQNIEEAVSDACNQIRGAYSLLILTTDKLIAVRDPDGIRPLYLGRKKDKDGDFYALASETCALDQMGAEVTREIEPGEMLTLTRNEITSSRCFAVQESISTCIFEKIYLSRPDSVLNDLPNEMFRHKLGKILFEENPELKNKLDLVVPVPDSGIPSAIGFHSASKIPYGRGIIKTPQAKRLFIDPSSAVRTSGVRLKLNVLKQLINGKRVGVVDDSIVRGSTSKELIKMLRKAGAREVHFMSASPAIKHPCFYGIDMSTEKELIASKLNAKDIAKHLGADGVYYLSLSGLFRAAEKDDFCAACFDQKYPVVFDCMKKVRS